MSNPDSAYPKGYSSWRMMRNRCNNPNKSDYKYYGGKGVTVDQNWNDFNTFLRDMGERPDGYTLERIDNTKGYSKGNCAWVSRAKQQYNTSQTKLTPADIPKIKALRKMGLTTIAIGKTFQIDPSTITRICSGKRWKEII